MAELTIEQRQAIDDILKSAAAIVSPDWHDYERLKRWLNRNGIYGAETIKQLADALRL